MLDPTTGQYIPGAALLDGHTLGPDATWHLQSFQNPAFTATVNEDLVSPYILNLSGETNQTLPTLNELRAALAATGRDDLTWEDINDYRARDEHGHVMDVDSATAGVQVAHTGEALLLDMNPHFDNDHIDAANVILAPAFASNPGDPGHLSFDGSGAMSYAEIGYYVDFATNSIRTTLSAAEKAVASELLLESVGDHYIAGDGRVNENFGLTSIHHVFHEDHNVQLLSLENQILRQQIASPGYAHEWQIPVAVTITPDLGISITAGHYEDANGDYTDAHGHVSWDNDRLFEATKLIVEMEYQHVAIDQYARLDYARSAGIRHL